MVPSAKILEAYKTTYAPGLSVREWLMRQDDGGEFVIKALLSKAMDNGSIENVPGVNLPVPEPPPTTMEECALTGLSFPDFQVRNLLRTSAAGKLICAPLELVRQERSRSGFLNRIPWGDSTENDIKVKHLTALRAYRRQTPDIPILAEQKTPGKPESAHRREAVAVLHDPRRHTRDKIRDLEEIVKDDILDKNVYSDADGTFVLCEHTLAVLSGDLEKDRTFFYDVWTAKVAGWRVCKYCGERLLADDFVDQDEFDEQGYVLNKKDALETGPVFHAESIAAFAVGLKSIAGLFSTDDPCDMIVFQLLSLLQVLPKAETVASRKASQIALEAFTKALPELLGGSADLTGSVFTNTSSTLALRFDEAGAGNGGRHINYGVREFGMAAIMNGVALHGGFIPYEIF
jgi:hypothetical protein